MNFFGESLSFSEHKPADETDMGLESPGGAGIFHIKEIKSNSHWSVPWSDLMMTMFILFCMLYAYPAAKTKAVQTTQKDELSRFYETSKETLKLKNYNDITSVELTKDRTVKIILPGDIFFDIGDAEIKTSASGSLAAVGELIKERGYAITVAGHTDNVPINSAKFPSNWELSTARACEAAKFLIEKMDITPDRLQVIGYAEYRPVASNETPEGRRANRRVEVIVSKEFIPEKQNTFL